MKLLFDFLPIVLFFATFKYAEGNKEGAAALASDYFGAIVSGGVVGPEEAPVLLATAMVIAASLIQVVVMLALRKKIPVMLWVSLVLVVVLGGATIWFHSNTFIKWKPTILYWTLGTALAVAVGLLRKNPIKALMGAQLHLPDPAWLRLNLAWAAFFVAMGFVNLYVAYNFATEAWVNFKVFGTTALMVVFTLAQGWYISRHALETDPSATSATPPTKG
jgi:intracellular septation protein